MLKKELLLQQFVSGWRKLTVGERYDTVTGSFTQYGFMMSAGIGSISDRFLEGYGIAWLGSQDYKDSYYKDYTQVIFDDYARFPANTLYIKRKDKDTLALPFTSGEGYKFMAYDTYYFTKQDVGKTIDIYLGTTPPLREKIRELFGLGGFSYAEQSNASLCRRNTRNGLVCRRRKLDSRESSMLWEQLQSWKNYFLQWGPQSFFDSNIYEKHFHCQNKRRVFDKGRDLQKRQRNKERPFSIGKLGTFLFQRCRQNCDGVLHSCVAYNRTSILGGAVC